MGPRTVPVVLLLGLLGAFAPPANAADAADPGQRLAGLLELADFPPERLEQLAASAELSPAQQAACVGLAIRLRRGVRLLEEAANSGAEPAAAVQLTGDIVAVEAIDPSGAAPGGAGSRGYVCKIRLRPFEDSSLPEGAKPPAGQGNAVWAIVPSVPRPWLAADTEKGVSLTEPVRLTGVAAGRWVVAPRIGWYPDRPSAAASFGVAQLGMLGYDAGLLDQLVDRSAILATEAEAFYQMLAAVNSIGPHQLSRVARRGLAEYAEGWRAEAALPPSGPGSRPLLAREVLRQASVGRYSIAPLFNDAVGQRGTLVVLEGVVRRVVRVQASLPGGGGPDTHGVDHYYELELFTGDSQNLPLVFCVRNLPEGFPTGDAVEQPARLAGFFLKRWAYRTRQAAGAASGGAAGGVSLKDQRSLAPLLIGPAPIPLAPPAARSPWAEVAAGCVFIAIVIGVCWAVWRRGRADQAFEDDIRARLAAPSGGVDFAHLTDRADT